MKSYKQLVAKNLRMQWKRNLLTSTGIILAIAFSIAIFSLLDTLIQFRINQAKAENGAFHFQIKECNEQQIKAISEERDIEHLGVAANLNTAEVESGQTIQLHSYDTKGAEMLGITLKDGEFPAEKGEIAVEEWFLNTYMKDAAIGDMININYHKGNGETASYSFEISGILNNSSKNQANGIPNAAVSLKDGDDLKGNEQKDVMIWASKGKSISGIIGRLKTKLSIGSDKIIPNKIVLILTDPENQFMRKMLYSSGLIVVAIVVFAAIIMIYNVINISIMDRIKQFGLLKCLGATNKQIKGMVLRESIFIALVSIIPGVVLGCLAVAAIVLLIKSNITDTISKYVPIIISLRSIIVGILIGLTAIIIASFKPAKKASKASPVHVASGSAFIKLNKKKTEGHLSKLLPVEIVMAIRNILLSKVTFTITALSLASGLFIFLTFYVFIDFLDISKASAKPYYSDYTLESENIYKDMSDTDFSYSELEKLASMEQVEKIYMKRYMEFTAKVPKASLTPDYTEYSKLKGTEAVEYGDGWVIPKDSGTIFSFDDEWMRQTEKFLMDGNIDNVINGKTDAALIVNGNFFYSPDNNNQGMRKLIQPTRLKVGDQIFINTGSGYKKLTVEGILNSLPDKTKKGGTLVSILVNHKVYEELTQHNTYQQIDIKVRKGLNTKPVEAILNEIVLRNNSRKIQDLRLQNLEANQFQFVLNVFIYGFIFIIVLIGFFNILNTMIMRIVTRTKEIGLIKTSGMTNAQILTMIIVEAIFYGLVACIFGSIIGIGAAKLLYYRLITSVFGIEWQMNMMALVIGNIMTIVITVISVIYPLALTNKISPIEATISNE
jgi:putative ABC transport system permease protein